MDRLQKSVALTVVAVVAVLAAGWFLLISPKHAEAEGLQEQVTSRDQANLVLRTELDVLRGKAEELPDKRAELAEVAVKLPAEPRLPDLLRALSAAASSTGVRLVSVAPGSLSPLTPPAAPAEAPAAAPGTDPAAPVGGISALPLTLTVTGTFYDVEAFLAAVEELPRALRLTGLALTPNEDDAAGSPGAGPAGTRPLSATLTGEVYVLSDAPATLAAPGVAAAPAPAAAGTALPEAPASSGTTPPPAPAAAD